MTLHFRFYTFIKLLLESKMTRKVGCIKFFLYSSFIAVVLVQSCFAKTKTDSDGDLKLDLVADEVKEGSEKRMY